MVCQKIVKNCVIVYHLLVHNGIFRLLVLFDPENSTEKYLSRTDIKLGKTNPDI